MKISQVSFVATKQVNEWTMLEYIQFLSFVNALTGLGEDTNILVQQKLVWERYSEDLDRDISEDRVGLRQNTQTGPYNSYMSVAAWKVFGLPKANKSFRSVLVVLEVRGGRGLVFAT